MRVATFNVHGWTDRSGRMTSGACIELLASLRCDAIVLQEVPDRSATLERVASELGMHASFAPASFLGNALLSRTPPSSFEVLPLHADGAEPRSAFAATLPWEGGRFTLVGTHLDHIRERARLSQIGALLEWMETLSASELFLLAGDLNSLTLADYDTDAMKNLKAAREKNAWEAPMGEVTALLRAAGWIDLWSLAGKHGELGTCFFGTRIDYVWAHRSFDEHARLVSCEHVPTSVSDHLPVVAEIESVSR